MSSSIRKISLLLLTDTAISGAGGSERFLRNLARQLPAQRYAIEVLQLSSEPEAVSRIAPQPLASHIQLHNHPVGPVYGGAGLACYRRLRRRIATGDFDIIQSHHEKSDLINALLPRGVAGTLRISCRRDMGFQKSNRVKAAFRLLNSRFDRIVAPTSAILETLQKSENVRGDVVTCIPNGVDTQRFAPAPAQARAALRAEFGFSPGDILIGCVASFTPVKRHCDLLQAFAGVVRQQPAARLLLVGAGPLQAAVEAQVDALNLRSSVRLMPPRGDVEKVLQALDLFVLGSSTEGMSNAVLEAQACGLPVVATAVGGNPDLVLPQTNGYLVAPLDPDSLAKGLADACASAAWRETAGRNAREQIDRAYSLGAMVAGFDRLYLDMLAQRDGPAGRHQPSTLGPQD